jgi:hypothetical protein
MITDKDVTKLKVTFVTKDEFNKSTADNHKKLDEIIEKLDGLAGGIQDKRDEQTLHQGQHDEISERLDRVDEKLGLEPL